ncbi:MAG: efflux transporter outer membrane subunit [Methylococcales bacterium]|nr:efflux transporter outer membrane subunit [Methylococcales bacterium]
MKRLSFCLLLILNSCVVGRDYQPPEMPIPQKWSEEVATQKTSGEWWKQFNDATLNELITEAKTANLNLKQALSRVKEARILRRETIATGLPSLSGKNVASRRFNNSSQGGGSPVAGQAINIFQLGFDAAWEIDFFGGIQRAVEAADASIDSEIENSRDVLLTLQAEVAREYMALRTNQQLVEMHKELLATQIETIKLLQIREQSGLSNALEVIQAQAQFDNLQANLPNYETEIKHAVHALSVLLGREPNALEKRFSNVKPISMPTLAITNLPSELLQRRPDIRKAERQMAMANAQVGIATAELYPKVNLAAFIGLQNLKITDFTPMGKSWSSASTITMPLFNWGKLQANIEAKDAQFEQAFLAYQGTVLTAFKEVEDALVAYQNESQRYEALAKAIHSNQTTLDLAKERYTKGLTGFLDVLQAQESLYQTQILKIQSLSTMTQQGIALHKALGGDFAAHPDNS